MHSKNEEFISLMGETGWSQAETARQLHISAAAVSQIVNGHATPRRSTLGLLKLLVMRGRQGLGELKEEPLAGLPDWASELISDLERLPERERQELVAAFRMIARRRPSKRVRYSESAPAPQELGRWAGAAARGLGRQGTKG